MNKKSTIQKGWVTKVKYEVATELEIHGFPYAKLLTV